MLDGCLQNVNCVPNRPRLLSESAKCDLRRHHRRLRLEALPAVGGAIQDQARRRVPPLMSTAGWLGLYWPLPGEVDLRGLEPLLRGRVALPAVESLDRGIVYRPWAPQRPLIPDRCGIPAPAPDAAPPLEAGEMSLLLVPALAFDGVGTRLGYGGGWFDRLRAEPPWRSVPALAVLPACCRVSGLPRDPWDVPFPGWLDEGGLHWLQVV